MKDLRNAPNSTYSFLFLFLFPKAQKPPFFYLPKTFDNFLCAISRLAAVMGEQTMKDDQLLIQYAKTQNEDAFSKIVATYLRLVFSVALRQVGGNEALAKDVTQSVFIDLARKAPKMKNGVVLSGWLYRATQFKARDLVRSESRRKSREKEASLMEENENTAVEDWEHSRPVLDKVICELNDEDRDAISLRFFDGRSFSEIAERLNLGENATRMRVNRALEKLRKALSKKGILSSAAALAAALEGQANVAIPNGFDLELAKNSVTLSAGATERAGATLFMKVGLGIVATISTVLFKSAYDDYRQLEDVQSQIAAANKKTIEHLMSIQNLDRPSNSVKDSSYNSVSSTRTLGTKSVNQTEIVTAEMVDERYEIAIDLLHKQGKTKEAFWELMWCFESGLQTAKRPKKFKMIILKLIFVSNHLKNEEGISVLREYRDLAEKRVIENQQMNPYLYDFIDISKGLQDEKRTLSLYDILRHSSTNKSAIHNIQFQLFDQLVERKRYKEALESHSFDHMLIELYPTEKLEGIELGDYESYPEAFGDAAMKRSAQNMEALLGGSQDEQAIELLDRIIEIYGPTKPIDLLEVHLNRVGRLDLLEGIKAN